MPDIPKTMRAALLTGHGGLDRLELRDNVPVPEPGGDEPTFSPERRQCGGFRPFKRSGLTSRFVP